MLAITFGTFSNLCDYQELSLKRNYKKNPYNLKQLEILKIFCFYFFIMTFIQKYENVTKNDSLHFKEVRCRTKKVLTAVNRVVRFVYIYVL